MIHIILNGKKAGYESVRSAISVLREEVEDVDDHAELTRRDLLDKRRLRAPGSAWRDADSARPDLERAKLTS